MTNKKFTFLWLWGTYDETYSVIYDVSYDVIYEKIQGLDGALPRLENQRVRRVTYESI